MYARLLLFVLFFVSWTFASSNFQRGSLSTTTKNNELCGRCGEKAILGKCCKGKLHDDGKCWCACQNGLDCATDEYCLGYWCVTEYPGKTCGACGKPPINNRCCGSGIEDKVNKTGLCYCKKGVTTPIPKCGRCGEKAIAGKCCRGKLHDDLKCWCTCQTGLQCGIDEYCQGYWCVTERPDQTCGACGKPPINNRCCGRGIEDKVEHTGLCICDIDTRCKGKHDCKANHVCCNDGSCDTMKQQHPCQYHRGKLQ